MLAVTEGKGLHVNGSKTSIRYQTELTTALHKECDATRTQTERWLTQKEVITRAGADDCPLNVPMPNNKSRSSSFRVFVVVQDAGVLVVVDPNKPLVVSSLYSPVEPYVSWPQQSQY